ncbi:MAG: hypothetical protein TU35_003375 [Thermoproteus sp. AZ2]|uniref:Uncharacterized protein n=1 Tax=Thermoproteus sp. AZ2 TaxID=1609232 RepID=A0ACC6V035_9CREN|nr:MAG: hypothetical protein TU35_06500 [Thermoproteus sp. AZ2]
MEELQRRGVKYYAYKSEGLTIVYVLEGDVSWAKPVKTLRAGGHLFLYLDNGVVLVKPEEASQSR